MPRYEDDDEDRPRRKRRDEDEDEDDEDDYEPRRGKLSRATLRGIAGNQKVIIAFIAIYLGLVVVQFAIPPETRIFLAIVAVPVLLIDAVFVFLLATKVYTTATGVILGVLTLIPCIGLIVLLIINGKATSILKANGIHVGLFGASMADI